MAVGLLGDPHDHRALRGSVPDDDTTFAASLDGVQRAMLWGWVCLNGKRARDVTVLIAPSHDTSTFEGMVVHWKKIFLQPHCIAQGLSFVLDENWPNGIVGTPSSMRASEGSNFFASFKYVRNLLRCLIDALRSRFVDGAVYVPPFLKIEVRFPHLRVSQFKSLFGLLARSPYSFSCLSFGLIVGRTPLDLITSIFGDTDHFGESGNGYLWVPARLVIDHLADVDHEYDFERLTSAISAVVRRFYGRVSFGFPAASTCGFTAFRAGVYAHYRMIRFELTQPVRPFPLSHPWMDPSALGSLAALF
jgi:hypothetical protein